MWVANYETSTIDVSPSAKTKADNLSMTSTKNCCVLNKILSIDSDSKPTVFTRYVHVLNIFNIVLSVQCVAANIERVIVRTRTYTRLRCSKSRDRYQKVGEIIRSALLYIGPWFVVEGWYRLSGWPNLHAMYLNVIFSHSRPETHTHKRTLL